MGEWVEDFQVLRRGCLWKGLRLIPLAFGGAGWVRQVMDFCFVKL